MHNRARPVALAVNLHRSTDTEANTRATEQRSRGLGVDASVEVEVGTVLVGTRETVLSAEWVAGGWAEVGNLDDDAVAGVRQFVARRVSLDGELPAATASWTGTGALFSESVSAV